MSAKTDFKRTLYHLLKHDHQGAFATRADRRTVMHTFTEQLFQLGYKVQTVQNLKTKHIEAVLKHWQTQGLSVGTLKNRLAVLRKVMGMMNKTALIPDNHAFHLGSRFTKSESPRNRALCQPDFSAILDPYVRISLELQRVFGLRREEALKLKPHMADEGDALHLMGSWCKGNRARTIPLRTEEQRHWLNQAKALCALPDHSLIPPQKSYIQQRHVYDKQTQRAGLKNLHGLRHAYAQQRYRELTGWEPPLCGGLSAQPMTKMDRALDAEARYRISEELGHSRKAITNVYLGK